MRSKAIIFADASASISEQLAALTNGHGADVVFSTSNTDPDMAREAWRCIARFGRFVDGGRKVKDVLRRKALDALPVSQRGASYLSFDLSDLYEARPIALTTMLRQSAAVFPGPFGASKPVITYAASAEKKDGLFQSMTSASWKSSVEPKILGAADLHSVLANDPLNFFPMTGNSAAANTYLDSLTRHRRQAGQAAVSIVLPMVLGVGVVAENTELEQALKRKCIYHVSDKTKLDHIIVSLDAAKLQKAARDAALTDSFWVEDTRFSHAVHDMNTASSTDDGSGGGQGGSGSTHSIMSVIKSAPSLAAAVAAVSDHLASKLSRILLLGADEFCRA
ncbi:hypothetical protein B0H63DRAFT_546979 [Podospora didyma]|uniref:Ketoreductase (KR) domain-containing protein n=1 Tax=Podospora didyma TaxID=330526 RepID=A0AAE0NB60_9PEZI|nr:hypothetical protein B0H63DRAFT_546979 [Podospora didyma]